MNKFLIHLKKEADTIRLTSAERQLMRARLLEAQSLRLAPSQPILSPYRRFLVPRLLALCSFIGIIAIGSGTVSAAQGALPGDILYPIKVNVTEPVEAALASSPREKAETNAKFAERRIHEVETLARRGILDEATAAQAARNFDYYAAQVEKHAKESSREDDRAFITEVADSLTQVADSLAEADDSIDAFSATTLPQTSELRSNERSNDEQDKNERAKKPSKDFADHVRARAWSMKHSGLDDDDDSGNSGRGSGEDDGARSGSGSAGGGDDGNTGGSDSGGDSSGSGSDGDRSGGDDDSDSDDSSSGKGSGDDSDDRDD